MPILDGLRRARDLDCPYHSWGMGDRGMPVTGTLETMSICELLRWLEQNKTGELELQYGKMIQKL